MLREKGAKITMDCLSKLCDEEVWNEIVKCGGDEEVKQLFSANRQGQLNFLQVACNMQFTGPVEFCLQHFHYDPFEILELDNHVLLYYCISNKPGFNYFFKSFLSNYTQHNTISRRAKLNENENTRCFNKVSPEANTDFTLWLIKNGLLASLPLAIVNVKAFGDYFSFKVLGRSKHEQQNEVVFALYAKNLEELKMCALHNMGLNSGKLVIEIVTIEWNDEEPCNNITRLMGEVTADLFEQTEYKKKWIQVRIRVATCFTKQLKGFNDVTIVLQ